MQWHRELALGGERPVYDQIKRAITSNIRSGRWPVGHRVPPEEEIAEHLSVARMTVNRALRELTEEGLITRRRGRGTFVARPPIPVAMLDIVSMSTEVPARGQVYRYRCLTQRLVEADEAIADLLRVPRGTPLRYVLCSHRADGEVVELEERWINPAVLPTAQTQDFSEVGPGQWLLSETPWTEAEHTVSVLNAEEDLVSLLEVDEGVACLVLERRTFQDDQVVTYARLTYPGDRHRLTGRFTPTAASSEGSSQGSR